MVVESDPEVTGDNQFKEHGSDQEQAIDLEYFIEHYTGKDGDEPLMEQILQAISEKDPTKLFSFNIDYNFLEPAMRTFVLGFNDFSLFSKRLADSIKKVVFKRDSKFYESIVDLNIKARFQNFLYDSKLNRFPNLIPIRSINNEQMNKYLCFRGIVRNIITSQMNLMRQKFKCLNCDKVMDLDFNNLDSYFDGKKCSNPDCKSTSLEMEETLGGTTDIQTLVIEELSNDSAESDASNVNVIIDSDLVNRFNLGDAVVVTGNMRLDVYGDNVINQFKKKITDSKFYNYLSIYGGNTNGLAVNFFIDANYIQKINETNIIFNILTAEEMTQIEALRTDHHLMEKMVQSIAPNIYGYDLEKEVLIYQHVGGNGRSVDPALDARGEIHVFFIGDSATAKSELMKWSLGIAYRARSVYAGNMTKAGLSGAAEQSPGGNWVLSAGVAVVADKGLLGIDEFNHAPPECVQPLNEIMEDQTTTITKVRRGSFKTRVSILACANPPDGNRYNKRKTFMENLGINTSLFTRFDYIGLFRDIPNPETDRKIAQKILNSYTKSNLAPIQRELLAKYIYFMKNQEFMPQFSKEAEDEYLFYYEKIRTIDFNQNIQHPDEQEHVSITARSLPTIHRFATARARIMGKKEVDIDDVKRAEFIVDHMLRTVGLDPETGQIDASILNGSKSSNELTREQVFFKKLEKMAASFSNSVNVDYFIDELRKESQWKVDVIDDKKLDHFMQKLIDQQNIIIVNGKISLVNFEPH